MQAETPRYDRLETHRGMVKKDEIPSGKMDTQTVEKRERHYERVHSDVNKMTILMIAIFIENYCTTNQVHLRLS